MVDFLTAIVSGRIPGIRLCNYKLADLEYADDIVILSSSLGKLKQTLFIYEAEAGKRGLKVNWAKKKSMHVSNEPDPTAFFLNSTLIQRVSSFVYLGSNVSDSGDFLDEICGRELFRDSYGVSAVYQAPNLQP